jgi:hypothetical protein
MEKKKWLTTEYPEIISGDADPYYAWLMERWLSQDGLVE